MFNKLFKKKVAEPSSLFLGEPLYNATERKLLIGNPKSEKGYDVVAKVYEGPNNCLYAKLENQDELIPIGRLV